jgi:excisionase family DNA binding protein
MSVTLDELPDVLKPAEFARLARIGEAKVYELIGAGRVRATRIGTKSWRIPKAEAFRFLGLDASGGTDAARR